MKTFLKCNLSTKIADEFGYQILKKIIRNNIKSFYYIQPWKDYEDKKYKSIIFLNEERR